MDTLVEVKHVDSTTIQVGDSAAIQVAIQYLNRRLESSIFLNRWIASRGASTF
jgi:hypothetical protein